MWSLFAALGLFAAGGAASITHGISELRAADRFQRGVDEHRVAFGVVVVQRGTDHARPFRSAYDTSG